VYKNVLVSSALQTAQSVQSLGEQVRDQVERLLFSEGTRPILGPTQLPAQ
jgi:hypothetical protein